MKKPEVLVLSLLAVLVIAAAAVLHTLTRPSAPPGDVLVEDMTGLADPVLLEEDLAAQRFHTDVDVVVYVREGQYEDNVNEETLTFAREHHPELIDHPYWRDGLLLITLSVEDAARGQGQIGTYFGEDLAPGESAETRIQQAGRDAFQSNNWNEGIIQVAGAAARLMDRPWYASSAVTVVAPGIIVVLLLAAGITIGWTRGRIDAAAGRLGEATTGIDDLMDRVEHIIIGEYAQKIRGTAHSSLREYTDLLAERDRLRSLPWLRLAFPGTVAAAGRFSGRVDGFTADLKVVRDSLTLYEHAPGWEQVWGAQLQGIREELRQVRSDPLFTKQRGAARDALLAYADEAERELDRLDSEMRSAAGDRTAETTDIALAQLEALQEDLGARTQAFLDESRLFEGAQGRYVEKATAKQLRSHRPATITGYYGRSPMMPAALIAGHRLGMRQYRQSQQRSSSSGGSVTRGFGSSGGGFRGSGSSSRF